MKQPSSTRRKQTAKAVILFFLGISVLCSCQRGIDITKIEAMPEGAAKDSAMLYYYQGVRPGDFVIVKKSTKDELNEINDSAIPIYLTTSAEVKRDQDLNVTNKVCQIFRGDTLQIVGGYDKSLSREKFMQKTDYSHAVIVKAIKNGKTVGEGWCDAGMFNPLQHNWAIVFYQPQDVLALLFIFGGAFFLVFLLWKLIYWLVVSKIRKNVCFYQRDKIYFKAIYLIVSALVGLFIFYVDYNEDLVSSLKFNPDFFAHFSDAKTSAINDTPLDRLYNRNAVGNDKEIQNMVAHHLFSRDMVDRIPDHCTYFCNKLVDLFHTADSGRICYHGTCQRQQFRKGDGQQQR